MKMNSIEWSLYLVILQTQPVFPDSATIWTLYNTFVMVLVVTYVHNLCTCLNFLFFFWKHKDKFHWIGETIQQTRGRNLCKSFYIFRKLTENQTTKQDPLSANTCSNFHWLSKSVIQTYFLPSRIFLMDMMKQHQTNVLYYWVLKCLLFYSYWNSSFKAS